MYIVFIRYFIAHRTSGPRTKNGTSEEVPFIRLGSNSRYDQGHRSITLLVPNYPPKRYVNSAPHWEGAWWRYFRAPERLPVQKLRISSSVML